MTDLTPQFSADPFEQSILADAVAWFQARQPHFDVEEVIVGSRQGFTADQCEALLWSFEAQAYLSRLLDDYQNLHDQPLPPDLHQVVDREMQSPSRRWNCAVLLRIGRSSDLGWSADDCTTIVEGLPKRIRRDFLWDQLAMHEERPPVFDDWEQALGPAPLVSRGAGRGRWAPTWDKVWKSGGFRLTARLHQDQLELWLGSAAYTGRVQVALGWDDGRHHPLTVEVRRGLTVPLPEVPCPGAVLPTLVTLRQMPTES
jgi:hypothetical protein